MAGMYKVGDVVRLIPPSFYALSKAGFLQPEHRKEADPTHDQCLMLGGRYTVLEVSVDSGRYLYRIAEPNPGAGFHAFEGWSSYDDSLVLDKDVENCPCKVGDKVLFRPKCSATDVKNLTTMKGWNLEDPDRVHEVRAVINCYYIVVDYEAGESDSIPLRWIDFERVGA